MPSNRGGRVTLNVTTRQSPAAVRKSRARVEALRAARGNPGMTKGGSKYAPFFTRAGETRLRVPSDQVTPTRKTMAGQARQAMADARRLASQGQGGLARSARSSARDLANSAPAKAPRGAGNMSPQGGGAGGSGQPRHPKGSPQGGQWR